MAYSFVFAQEENLGNTNGTTTAARDTSGCDLLVAVYVASGASSVSITDNKSNTWSSDSPGPINVGGVYLDCWYAINPTVGSGHTVTQSGYSNYPGVILLGFSGSKLTAPLDQQSTFTQFGGADSIQPGSITPSETAELILTAIGRNLGAQSDGVDSGFTLGTTTVNSSGYILGVARKIKTDTAAENPTWTAGAGVYSNASCNLLIVSFKAADTGGAALRVGYGPRAQLV